MQTLSEIEQASPSMVQDREHTRWELELHPDGGLLVSSDRRELLVGDALELSLRLTTGAQFSFSARVCRLTTLPDTGEAAAWIELTDLSIIERRELRRWQAHIRRERGMQRIPVEVECKLRFRRFTPVRADWSNARCH